MGAYSSENPELPLNDKEKEIFDVLLDKLLHKEKDDVDIDIAVDNMSGEEFAIKVSEFASEKGGISCTRVVKIQTNPDQSKHLETATFTVCGVSIDVNKLRTETYTDSRIPITKDATAEEDADRRDFTINAMFYNVCTGEVEDFCKKGRQDLKDGLLRTPLDPKVTFKDDPLRVLRAIRFASRLDFKLHEDIKNATMTEELRYNLRHKVSRERIGIEVDKSIASGLFERRIHALQLIHELELYSVVFDPPAPLDHELPSADVLGKEGLRICDGLQDVESVRLKRALYAGFLYPLVNYRSSLDKKKPRELVRCVLQDSLKRSNDDANSAAALTSAAFQFEKVLKENSSDSSWVDPSPPKNKETVVQIGLQMRMDHVHDDWQVASTIAGMASGHSSEAAKGMVKFALDWGLDKCWTWDPPFDGRWVCKEYNIPAGPAIKAIKDIQTAWQLQHPNWPDKKEDLKRHLADQAQDIIANAAAEKEKHSKKKRKENTGYSKS